MIYAHESNLKNKIKKNYNNKSTEIEEFYENYYLPMRNEIRNISFSETDFDSFSKATKIFNNYYKALVDFSLKHKVMSQSKFTSTFLEEISSYLFKDLPDIKSNTLGIYNKHIYAGLKINGNRQIDVIRKDVDFCIGKKVHVSIENQPAIELIIPAIRALPPFILFNSVYSFCIFCGSGRCIPPRSERPPHPGRSARSSRAEAPRGSRLQALRGI